MAWIKKRPNGKWRAGYWCSDPRCPTNATGDHQHNRHFTRKVDAQDWLDDITADIVTGRYVSPSVRRMTVDEWCDVWLEGYGSRRASTVRQARTHLNQIRDEFGHLPLTSIRPSLVRSWLSRLSAEGYADSYIFALHNRLSQIMTDAAMDNLIVVNPCSRRTSPGAGSQRAYVATTEQIWGLYNAFPPRLRLAILLGAFAGLRNAEACGLRVEDVAFLKREIHPTVQYPAEELKTEMSRTPVPVADLLLEQIAGQLSSYPADTILSNDDGSQVGPWQLQRAMRRARAKVDGLPDAFRFQDLRHYFASLLIASGADVKVVQHRLRHASAKTTLDTYGHLWPDSDESTRSAVERVLSEHLVDSLWTGDEERP